MRTRSSCAIVLAAGLLLAGCQGPAGDTTPHSGSASPLGSTGSVTPIRPAPGSCQVIEGRADVRCTPGAINLDVTQATIGTTVCVPGWTVKIRPPAAYTNLLKTSQMIEYGQTGPPSDFEEDHLINLGIGGAPQDPHNLFPQPRTGPRSASVKDQEETQLQRDWPRACLASAVRNHVYAGHHVVHEIDLTGMSDNRYHDALRLHEVWEQLHLAKALTFCGVDCVFDVGANRGQYASMLRRKAGYRGLIVSFEPIPKVAAELSETAAQDPMWLVECLALAHRDGQQTFNIMAGDQFSSLSDASTSDTAALEDQNTAVQKVTVRTETLGTAYRRLAAQHGFTRPFLKLDTQGYDVKIVQAGREVLHRFVGLQSELAVKRLYADSVDFREALTIYQECGFELSAFVPNNAGHFPMLLETDCIMLRRDLMPGMAAGD